MPDIDWTKADAEAWEAARAPESDETVLFSCTRPRTNLVVDVMIGLLRRDIDAHEIVTLHNYRLAQERRPRWFIERYDHPNGPRYEIWGREHGKPIAEAPLLLAAMAEFVRLDGEIK